MDIRDIKGDAPKYDGDYLEQIFKLQEELLIEYTKIEKLPEYPIDINTKDSQVLIKDFISRIVEELGEGWESWMIIYENLMLNDDKKCIVELQNFNEELSDALHFLIETFIVVGLDYKNLKELLGFGESNTNILKFFIDKNQMGKSGTPFLDTSDPRFDEFLRGGRVIGFEMMKDMAIFLWDITYNLQLARNSLKNKPWKQTGVLTDRHVFFSHLINSFVQMLRFFALIGMTDYSIFTIYYKKNRVNVFRQRSKY